MPGARESGLLGNEVIVEQQTGAIGDGDRLRRRGETTECESRERADGGLKCLHMVAPRINAHASACQNIEFNLGSGSSRALPC
jgi:hypothetical protein